jgi:hypothetical protein
MAAGLKQRARQSRAVAMPFGAAPPPSSVKGNRPPVLLYAAKILFFRANARAGAVRYFIEHLGRRCSLRVGTAIKKRMATHGCTERVSKKDAGSGETRVESPMVSSCLRSLLAVCDLSQRSVRAQPLTKSYPGRPSRNDAGWVAPASSGGWLCRVKVSAKTHGSAACAGMVDEPLTAARRRRMLPVGWSRAVIAEGPFPTPQVTSDA